MKVKLLKEIRKYWDYKFCGNEVYARRKADGEIRQYGSISTWLRIYMLKNHDATYFNMMDKRRQRYLNSKYNHI